MRRLVSALIVSLFVLGSLSAPQLVWAQDDDSAKEVEQLSKDGAAKYRAGEYKEAISLFKDAYRLQPVSNLLFNIARCYEQLEDWERSLKYYDKFILDAENKKARQKALDKVKMIKDKQAEEAQAKKEEKKGDEKKKDEKPQNDPEPETNLTGAYVGLGAGSGLIVGGVVFGLLANGQQSIFDDSTDPDEKASAKNSGETYALVADVMYAAGAVAVITGVILWATASPDEPAQQARWVPTGWVGPNGAGVGLGTTF